MIKWFNRRKQGKKKRFSVSNNRRRISIFLTKIIILQQVSINFLFVQFRIFLKAFKKESIKTDDISPVLKLFKLKRKIGFKILLQNLI